MQSMFKALMAYRGFILGSIKREFQSKYRNSLLGAAWTVINPLAMIIVYTVIFSNIMQAKLPGIDSTFGYSIYLCTGIIVWGLFAEITSEGQNVFLKNANLLKKLSFPRICLPIIVVANACVSFAIIFTLFAAFLLISGDFPGLPFLAIFPLLALLIIFALGLGITLGILNVFFRDVGQFFGIFITFWFWLTPIVYPITILPERIQSLLSLNPMAPLLGAFQDVLVRGNWPQWESLWLVAVLGIMLCIIGMGLFRRHVGEIVDEL